MPHRAEDAETVDMKIGIFKFDLEYLPVEDLIRCFSDWRSGRHRRGDGSPWAPSIAECRALVEQRIGDRGAAARRRRDAEADIAESAALRERLAARTPDDLARVKIVQDMLAGAKITDGRLVMGPLGPHPMNVWTYEQLDDENCIINGKGTPYTMRPDNAMYPHRAWGYLTALEAAASRVRPMPPADLDKYARETLR